MDFEECALQRLTRPRSATAEPAPDTSQESPPLAASHWLGDLKVESRLTLMPVYVRDGKRYYHNPRTDVEEEADPMQLQARICENGTLIPLTDDDRLQIRKALEDRASTDPMCRDQETANQ